MFLNKKAFVLPALGLASTRHFEDTNVYCTVEIFIHQLWSIVYSGTYTLALTLSAHRAFCGAVAPHPNQHPLLWGLTELFSLETCRDAHVVHSSVHSWNVIDPNWICSGCCLERNFLSRRIPGTGTCTLGMGMVEPDFYNVDENILLFGLLRCGLDLGSLVGIWKVHLSECLKSFSVLHLRSMTCWK